jgi:hypothetical protein
MSKYKGLFTFDEDNDRYVPIAQADGIIDTMDYEPDSKPAEPLIRDEKTRKAVRAWAEAGDINVVTICKLYGGWGVRHDWEDGEIYSIDLLFKGDAPLGIGNQYTITELCGEEEE